MVEWRAGAGKPNGESRSAVPMVVHNKKRDVRGGSVKSPGCSGNGENIIDTRSNVVTMEKEPR